MKAISTDAIFTRFSSRADFSMGFSGCTPEMDATERVALMELHGKNVRLLIQPMDSPPEELITVANDLQQKTPSQRLRSVLYKQFTQLENKTSDFQGFYNAQMERILEAEKAKLEPSPF